MPKSIIRNKFVKNCSRRHIEEYRQKTKRKEKRGGQKFVCGLPRVYFAMALKERIRRFIAFILTIAMVICNVPISVFAAQNYPSELDGWKVRAIWNETLTTDYEWSASEASSRQPKINVSYRLENANKDYPAGSVQFTVPGIGNALRSTVLKAQTATSENTDSEWLCDWDSLTDTYTFINNFTVKEGESLSGGFELVYDLQARDCENGFSQEKPPTFSISDVGQITMEPLSFKFESIRDKYRLRLDRSMLSGASYAHSDKNFIWYNLTTGFDSDYLARGLYKSIYTMQIALEDGLADGDLLAKYNGRSCQLTRIDDQTYQIVIFRDKYGDLSTMDQTGSETLTLGFRQSTLEGKIATASGHLDRLYQDESEWVAEAGQNENVDVETAFTVESYGFSSSGYDFSVQKWNEKYENDGEKWDHTAPEDKLDRLPSVSLYNGTIIPFTLKGNAVQSYSATQSARNKARRRVRIEAATPSDADVKNKNVTAEISEEILTDNDVVSSWDDIHWMEHELAEEVGDSFFDLPTYEEVHAESQIDHLATSSNAVGDEEDEDEFLPDIDIFKGFSRLIGKLENSISLTAFADENLATESEADMPVKTEKKSDEKTDPKYDLNGQPYDMVLGDDKLAITLNNGSIRPLEDNEYDFVYVTLPKCDVSYNVEVYASEKQDANFSGYRNIASGTTDHGQTILLPSGIKAIFVSVNQVADDFAYPVSVGVRMHLDWDTEQEKEEPYRPDHEGILTNFAYLRILAADDEGNTKNIVTSEYQGTFATEYLAPRDLEYYGEYLLREYSHVWIRNLVTTASTYTSVDPFDGNQKTGFKTTVTASGTVKSETPGPLNRFSVYIVLPQGMTIDPDDAALSVTGKATDMDTLGEIDLADYTSLSIRESGGKTVLVADVDLTDCSAQISRTTNLRIQFPASVSYVDFQTYGGYYSVETDLMIHDDGIENLSGYGIKKDEYDLDEDGNQDDYIAFSSKAQTITEKAAEWREYATKYVKSAYSNGYVAETVTRLYDEKDTEENQKKSMYSYRLDYGLGADEAKNMVFYDRLEQGGVVSDSSTGTVTDKKIASEWQGTFESVDVSQPEKIGLMATIYYSENPNQEFDLTADGWTTTCPDNRSKVKAIAVALDTSALENGVLANQQKLNILVNMRAPENRSYVDKTAVNQYTVTYDAYDVSGAFKQNYVLPSTVTYVKLLDSVGRVTLQKVDADHVVRTDADGTKHYAALAGAKIQVYDPDGKALFEKGGRKVDNFGRLILQNVKYGTYAWEETEAPAGYEKVSGKHPFEISDTSSMIYVENQRVRGSVTMTKLDQDNKSITLSGATYQLYDSEGQIIRASAKNVYDSNGSVDRFTTSDDGTFTISGLPWGTYYFLESEAPAGYQLNQTKIRFEIGDNTYNKVTGTIHVAVTGTDAEESSTVTLTKKDAENGAGLKNAYYRLYKKVDGIWKLSLDTLKTNASGELTVENLKFGTYKFQEVMPPVGYQLSAEEPEFTIDAQNAGSSIQISHEDDRKTGSAQLVKTDQDGVFLTGAEFALYKDGGDAPVAEHLRTDADGVTPAISGLSWGGYYYKETEAPIGYKISDKQYRFTVSAENADALQKVQVADERQLGTVVLAKMDEASKSLYLSGAEFTLYNSDGTIVKKALVTGEDGTVTVTSLDWGSYYFEETKAPDGYSLSASKIRFSVNAENATAVQRVVCYDPVGLATLVIRKDINEAYGAFGNAQFVFEISGTDVSGIRHTFKRTLAIADGTNGEVTISGIPAGTYTVRELNVGRYLQEEITGSQNVVCDPDAGVATVTLAAAGTAEVTFKNRMTQYEKFSHNAGAMNVVNKKAQITGLRADYTGETVLSAKAGTYAFTSKNIAASALYDDGTVKVIPFSQLTITPSDVSTQYGGTYTIAVSYTEAGVTVSDKFTVTVVLEKPEGSLTVTYYANGGYFGNDPARTVNQVNYQKQDGTMTVISGTEEEPKHPEKIFDGWYLDADCTDGNEFTGTESAQTDISVYAKYKTGVSIIDESKFADALIKNRLVREEHGSNNLPADGTNTIKVGNYVFWVENEELRFYPNADLTPDDLLAALKALGLSNVDITAIKKSDVRPDDSLSASIISGDGSNTDTYLWKDGDTLYWWSQALHPVLPKQSDWLFAGYPKLVDVSGLAYFDTSNVENISAMFRNDASLVDLSPIAGWKVDKVSQANEMFKQCNSLEDIDALSGWNLSNLQSADSMFSVCSSLRSIQGMANWNAKIKDLSYFLSMSGVESLDGIQGINPSTVGTKLAGAFADCKNLTDISALAAWSNKVSNLDPNVGLKSLFGWDSSLKDISALKGWKISGIKTLRETFVGCGLTDLTPLKNWDVSSVENMSRTFQYNGNLVSLAGLETWDVSNVIYFSDDSVNSTSKQGMFYGCSAVSDISALSNWDTSSMAYANTMFRDCDGVSDWTPLKNWDTHNLRSANQMFYACPQLTSLVQFANWDTGSLEYAWGMFERSNLKTLTGLENWDTSKMIDIHDMFNKNILTDITAISTWFGQSNQLKNIKNLFAYNYDLVNIDALQNWDVSKVANLFGFLSNTGIESVSALSTWDTSSVTDLSEAFRETKLKNLDGLQQWDVSHVQAFNKAFIGLSRLNDASAIEEWDLASGADFDKMFALLSGTDYTCNGVLPTFSKKTGKFSSDGTFVPDH